MPHISLRAIENKDLIVDLYSNGLSLRSVASRIGVSYTAIHNLLKRSEIARRGTGGSVLAWPEERRKAHGLQRKGKPSSTKGMRGRWKHAYRSKPWMAGERNFHWKGGRTPLCQKIRNSSKYSEWRASVFKRDNFTCVLCGKRGGKLQADHHRISFSSIMDLNVIVTYEQAMRCESLWDISNGRSLCFPCHKTTSNYAGRSFRKVKVS